ncbi:NagC family transcriptional regulator [Bifidobacterium primatium]|uniref:NagC family transcriptional regulator n=1 Tax=Bifidobacterium primatium TaxID=2045438 RepID=A0A2M9H6J5_9BIFI|nr:ROK family protein [Bifidobacterium primatium]PJM72439.1 NagC family transcriptional regulator [Bifidobacterium primatium]
MSQLTSDRLIELDRAFDGGVSPVSDDNDADGHTTLHIGVDVGGTKIEGVLIGLDGHGIPQVIDDVRIPARRGERRVMEDVLSVIRMLCDRVSERNDGSSVSSVGIGTPGRVDSAAGVVEHIANLDVSRLEFAKEIGAATGLAVYVENDVNTAALGAHAVMGGDHERNEDVVAFLNLGTGVAAGILRNGVLDHGSSGVVGEIGHIPVEPHCWKCACGQYGCLETACGGAAIMRQWPEANPPLPDIIAKAYDETSPRHTAAVRTLNTIVRAIASAIDILAVTVDPRIIILGGGTVKTGKPLLDEIRAELRRRESGSAFIDSLHLPERVVLVPDGKPIGAIGAACAAIPMHS